MALQRKARVRTDGTKSRGWGNGWLIKPTKENGYRYWVAAWRYDGKIHKRSTGMTTEKEAGEVADRIMAEVKALREHDYTEANQRMIEREQNAVNAIRKDERTMTARQSVDALAALGGNLNAATITGYQRVMSSLCDWLDEHRKADGGSSVELRKVGMVTLVEWLRNLKAQAVTASSRQCYFLSVKGVFKNIAAYEQARVADPTSRARSAMPWARLDSVAAKWWLDKMGAQMPLVIGEDEDVAPKARKALTLEELRRLLAVKADREMWLLLRIGAQMGTRLGDTALLTFGKDGNIRLDEGKTGRFLVTPHKTHRHSRAFVDTALGGELHGILAELPQAGREGAYVTPTLAALYKKDPSGLARKVRLAFEAAGFNTTCDNADGARAATEYSFYSLRMTVARLHSSVSLAGAAEALGHSRPGTNTRLYANGAKLEEDREAEAQAWERWYHSTDGEAAQKPQDALLVRAGELGRKDVTDAQRPVYDAVCAMLAGLESDTLKAVASEALKLAMANQLKAVRAAS